jgi:amidase
VEEASPDFSDADEIFKTLRAWSFAASMGDELRLHRDQLKDTIIWNIEAGLKLTGAQISQAEVKRTALYHRMREFMTRDRGYEFMLLPTVQVPPFDVAQPYVTQINGQPMTTYIDWMKSCYYITVLGHPAISVPCGFTGDGLPVGLQIVGRHQDDWGVLQLAYAFEQATQFWKQRPAISQQN